LIVLSRIVLDFENDVDAPEEILPDVSKSFRLVQLRLLMKDREEVISNLVQLDYSIWVLEEFFRANDGADDSLSAHGTAVPEGSLSPHAGDPRP
jgi:hypothetical protein